MDSGGRPEVSKGILIAIAVGKTERILRYQIGHMIVCYRVDAMHQAGWHRRSITLVPAVISLLSWAGVFLLQKKSKAEKPKIEIRRQKIWR